MKVLIYVADLSLSKGGPSHSAVDPIISAHTHNYDFEFVTYHSLDSSGNHKLSKESHFIIKENSIFELWFRLTNCDIIHVHGLWSLSGYMISLFGICFGKKVVISPRGMLEKWSLEQNRFLKKMVLALGGKIILRNSHLIATGDIEYATLSSYSNRVTIIPNGIDIKKFKADISWIERKFNERNLIFVSRIHKKKGWELLIDVVDDLNNEGFNCSLSIYGMGDFLEIEKLKMKVLNSNSISYKGAVYDEILIQAYQEAYLFVLPTYSENFGNVIGESLSCGTPVITTNNTPWGIIDGQCGRITSLNKTEIKGAIKEYFEMPFTTYETQALNARKLINKNFTIDKISKKTIEFYDSVQS